MGMFSKGLTKAVKSKKKSSPTQRSYGKGMGRGKVKGRIQGGAAGLSVAAILEIRNKKRLEELKEQNLNANQRAAVNRALRQIAQKEAAKAKMGGVKPKPRPQMKRGGAVKKK